MGSEMCIRDSHIVATLPSKHFDIIASKILWKNAQKESGIEECYEELFLKYADNILEIEDSIWDIAEERKIDEESRLSRKKLFGRFQHSPVDLFTLL